MSYYGKNIPFKEQYTEEWKKSWHPVTVLNEKLRHVKIRIKDTGKEEAAVDFHGQYYLVINGFFTPMGGGITTMGDDPNRIEIKDAEVIEDRGPVLKPTT
jgi:hypothetical protein